MKPYSFNRVQNIRYLLGVAGVDAGERLVARRLGIVFEIPMLMAALWILLSWWAQRGTSNTGPEIYDLMLWSLFIVETLVLAIAVQDTANYLKTNWLNLVIIAAGLPALFGWAVSVGAFRLLRVIVVFALIMHAGSRVRDMLSRNELGATLLATLIVIILAGFMMAVLDPGIQNPWDGIWWAWVTITTVGYGDVVPQSNAGRALGSVIILLGIGLFAMLTASFAAFFIRQDEEKIVSGEEVIEQKIRDVETQLDAIEAKIDALAKSLPDTPKS